MECIERDLLSVIPLFVWQKDCEGHYKYANPAFCALVGRSVEYVLGKTDKDVWDEATAARFTADEERVALRGTPLHKQDLVTVGGKSIWVEFRLSPVINNKGEVIAIAGIGDDISSRKELEGQLASALDTALEARHMASLGIMAAGITHELNQPLQAIKLSADSIVYWFEKKKTFDPKGIMKALGLISRNSDRIQRIIQRVRNFVKSRQAVAQTSAVDLNRAVRDGLEMIEHQLMSHGIELILQLEPNIPAVSGDETQIEEVVINLVTNARQSLDLVEREDKKIMIETRASDQGVCLIISDTGTGFSADALVNLFRPFFTTKAEGLGLGLSIVHSIVTGFSGKIELLPPANGFSTVLVVTLRIWSEEEEDCSEVNEANFKG
jgi:PAS domain S-box-containing protein